MSAIVIFSLTRTASARSKSNCGLTPTSRIAASGPLSGCLPMRIIETAEVAAKKRAEPLDISRNTVSGFMAVFYGGGGGRHVLVGLDLDDLVAFGFFRHGARPESRLCFPDGENLTVGDSGGSRFHPIETATAVGFNVYIAGF